MNCAPEELPRIASGRKIIAKVRMLTDEIFKLTIGLRKRTAEGYLAAYRNYWVAYLNSETQSINVTEIASRWTQDMFPLITSAYITSQQLVDLVDSLNVVERSQTTILDYVTRSAKEEETIKHWPKNLEFSKENIRARARRDGALVDAIRIHFVSPNFGFRVKLGRRGRITFYDGSYSEFHRLVITDLVKKAKLNLDTMRERKRLISKDEIRLEPFSISLDPELSKEDLIQLKDTLGRKYMTAVLYGGNPWLLLSLIDKSDGSTFNLQAYHDEIIVTPVIRISSASLTRLYSALEEVLPNKISQPA